MASLEHSPHSFFTATRGDLLIGDQSVLHIARHVGRTPLYLYSRSAMAARLAALRAVIPREVELHYAIKANPMPDIVRFYSTAVDGMDVASIAEMQVALDAGAKPGTISFAGPGKSTEELRRAVAAGIVITLESEGELDRLLKVAGEEGRTPAVCLRLNPEFELKGSGMKMGGGAKPFGVDAAAAPALVRRLARAPVEFLGLHIFCGSQSLSPEAIVEAQTRSVELAVDIARSTDVPMSVVNIGGGFGIPYFPGERPLDLRPIGMGLSKLVEDLSAHLPGCRIRLELGRYLVGEAGIYVTTVLDKKVSRGRIFLVTDGGLNHHLAASGNFGQVIRRNYPVTLLTAEPSERAEVVTVVGRLCTPLDILAEQVHLPAAREGDLVAILQSGAYGLTASPTAFLSHPLPSEVLW